MVKMCKIKNHILLARLLILIKKGGLLQLKFGVVVVVVVVNHCFTSLFGTKGLLSDIIIR